MAQVIIIKKNDKPYYVGLVSEVKQNEYLQLVKECIAAHEEENNKRRIIGKTC